MIGGAVTRLPWLRRARRGGVLTAASAAVVAVLVATAVLAPVLAPHDPSAIDLSNSFAPAGGAHLMGTDQTGRDIFSRLIWGSRSSLVGPLAVVVVSTVLGLGVGVVAGWRGGMADAAISRLLDLLFSFPGLLLAIIAATLFGTGLIAPIVALSIAYLPWIARSARAAILLERERPYIAACRVQGMSAVRTALLHAVPNVAPVVIAQAAINFGYVLIDLAAVSYLGLGVQPPAADWGLMISEGQATIVSGAPEEALWASAACVVAVVAFNVLADAVADRVAGRRR